MTLALFVAMVLALSPANSEAQGNVPWSKSPIEGVWNVRVTIRDCSSGNPLGIPTFDALAMFNANGTFHDTNSNSPMLQIRSDAFGYWKHVGGNTYRFAFKAFHFDLSGMYIGYNIVRHNVVLAASGDSYTSEGTVEFFNPDGTTRPPVRGCSTTTATPFE